MSTSINPHNTTIAFLGIGLMGLPMAANLLSAGFKLHAWNRTRSKAEALGQHERLTVFDRVEDAIADADVVITMLENGDIVEQVLFSLNQFLASRPDTLFIDMSSIPPSTARDHHDRLQADGRRYLDAPVSGGTLGAAQATLSIMAGGAAADFEFAMPLLETLGTPIHIGPVGTGQMTKLANQAIVGITIGAVSEALLLATAGGADPSAVRKALGGGFASSRILELHGQRMIDRDFLPGATSRVQLKDLRTVLSTAEQQQLTLPLTEQVFAQYQQLVENGGEEFDHSALLLQLESINKPHKVVDAGPELPPLPND